MARIVITQKNWDGNGNDRRFYSYPRNNQEMASRLVAIRRAYNLDSGSTRVEIVDGTGPNPNRIDVTETLKAERITIFNQEV